MSLKTQRKQACRAGCGLLKQISTALEQNEDRRQTNNVANMRQKEREKGWKCWILECQSCLLFNLSVCLSVWVSGFLFFMMCTQFGMLHTNSLTLLHLLIITKEQQTEREDVGFEYYCVEENRRSEARTDKKTNRNDTNRSSFFCLDSLCVVKY